MWELSRNVYNLWLLSRYRYCKYSSFSPYHKKNFIYLFTVSLMNVVQDFEWLKRNVQVSIFNMQYICLKCNFEWLILMLDLPNHVYIECIGYFGINCGVPCLAGWFGPQCKLFCNCSENETCNPFVGCLSAKSKMIDFIFYFFLVVFHFSLNVLNLRNNYIQNRFLVSLYSYSIDNQRIHFLPNNQ